MPSNERPRLVGGKWVAFDGMTWPVTGEPLHDLEYVLRYGTPTAAQLLQAASLVHAYGALVHDPERKRRRVIRAIRSVLRRSEGGR